MTVLKMVPVLVHTPAKGSSCTRAFLTLVNVSGCNRVPLCVKQPRKAARWPSRTAGSAASADAARSDTSWSTRVLSTLSAPRLAAARWRTARAWLGVE